jgi:hypothetical protein
MRARTIHNGSKGRKIIMPSNATATSTTNSTNPTVLVFWFFEYVPLRDPHEAHFAGINHILRR